MQKEEDKRCNSLASGMSDLNSVDSILFKIYMDKHVEIDRGFYEFRDRDSGETISVHCHKLFIRQNIIDVVKFTADTPHREAIYESDGPETHKIKHEVK